jgi:heme-binding protein
MDVNGGRLDIA